MHAVVLVRPTTCLDTVKKRDTRIIEGHRDGRRRLLQEDEVFDRQRVGFGGSSESSDLCGRGVIATSA